MARIHFCFERVLPVAHEIDQLAERAEDGDTRALTSLTKILETRPLAFLAVYGAVMLCQSLAMTAFSKMNAELAEMTAQLLKIVRTNVSGNSPSRTEEYLVERVILTLIDEAHCMILNSLNAEAVPATRDYFAHLLADARERHLRACKLLERVQKRQTTARVRRAREASGQQSPNEATTAPEEARAS